MDAFKRRIPRASASALSSILEEAKHDVPEITHRSAIRQALGLIMRRNGEHGALFGKLPAHRADGSAGDLAISNPFAFLNSARAAGGGFGKAAQRLGHERRLSCDSP